MIQSSDDSMIQFPGPMIQFSNRRFSMIQSSDASMIQFPEPLPAQKASPPFCFGNFSTIFLRFAFYSLLARVILQPVS